ncbi:hypothetical protein TIFTF001_033909 [Ficus carica]|uniref:Uncharacterized protein n=1 Tax=Ficus carica TaxID=3494 RepID=A0AA88E2V9_FICCA|nr:hypothetical protein TIFTF001_033909 [Ficus carica]
MISRMQYVVSTRVRSGLVHGLSWTGLAAPTTPWQCATVSKLIAMLDTRQWSMARQTVKLWDGNHYAGRVRVGIRETGPAFRFHSMLACATVIPHLQVALASRCLAVDARLWWRTQGENEVQGGLWEDFRNAIIARFGPIREEDAGMHYRDPDIYRDMNTARYLNYVYDWHAYPVESMGHYCRRFQEAMLPHIPDWGNPEMRALQLLREGLPPKIREHVQPPALDMTLDHMINEILDAELVAHVIQADAMINDQEQEPIDNIGIEEPQFQWGPELQEDPIPAVPLQEIPPQEEGIDAEAIDLDEFPENLELQEDPPEIVMDEEEEEQVNVEDDPEEIMFDEEDLEVFSNVSSE